LMILGKTNQEKFNPHLLAIFLTTLNILFSVF